jgi:hypothetical protein
MNGRDERLALFVLLGRTAEQLVELDPQTVPAESLSISDTFDLSISAPAEVKKSMRAAFVYKLFFIFENYLRELILSLMSEAHKLEWWGKIDPGVQKQVAELKEKEETKLWMALEARDQLSLVTYPQLLAIMEFSWKDVFDRLYATGS